MNLTPQDFTGDTSDLSLKYVQELYIREQVFGESTVIRVPANYDAEFWRWYADYIRFGRPYTFEIDPAIPLAEFPQPDKPAALWFSGGAESSYVLHQIQQLNPDLLHIEDYPVFTSKHRRFGQIHFMCTVIAAQLGYQTIYMGIEKYDLFLCHTAHSHQFVERTPLFVEQWNRYRSPQQLSSPCSHLRKEEVIEQLHRLGTWHAGSCDRFPDRWCGQCFKCFEAFYAAKAKGIDLGFRLTREAFEQFYEQEYQRYIRSGFRQNPFNALQFFVILQIEYGLEFDPAKDCA